MKDDFENEVIELTSELKKADGYLQCEAIILANMQKQADKNNSITFIVSCLKRLQKYFEDKAVINKGNVDCVNYKYAVGFLNTVIATPYWHSWIRATN